MMAVSFKINFVAIKISSVANTFIPLLNADSFLKKRNDLLTVESIMGYTDGNSFLLL